VSLSADLAVNFHLAPAGRGPNSSSPTEVVGAADLTVRETAISQVWINLPDVIDLDSLGGRSDPWSS
jgi:hypothetical protein